MPEYTVFPSLVPTTGERGHESVELAFANDTCPWCGESYENVQAHASQQHSDAWTAWKQDGDG